MRLDRTFLGIDYGTRRIGVAKSDLSGMIASSYTVLTVKSVEDAVKQLSQLIGDVSPDGIVFGYPLHQSGEVSKACLEIDKFILKLQESISAPIHRFDESYTSEDAHDVIHAHGKKVGQDKKRIDAIAAVIILQRFLDEQAFHSGNE